MSRRFLIWCLLADVGVPTQVTWASTAQPAVYRAQHVRIEPAESDLLLLLLLPAPLMTWLWRFPVSDRSCWTIRSKHGAQLSTAVTYNVRCLVAVSCGVFVTSCVLYLLYRASFAGTEVKQLQWSVRSRVLLPHGIHVSDLEQVRLVRSSW